MKTLNWKIGNKCSSVLNIDAHLLRKKLSNFYIVAVRAASL